LKSPYVNGQPTNYRDPEGTCGPACILVIAGIGGGTASAVGTYAATGNVHAAIESIPAGALGGVAAVASALAAPETLAGILAGTVLDTAISTAGDTAAIANILNPHQHKAAECPQ